MSTHLVDQMSSKLNCARLSFRTQAQLFDKRRSISISLIEQQESSVRDRLGEYRKNLRKLNQEIEGIESQLHPDIKRALEEMLTLKQKQIGEHKKIEPPTEQKPSEQLTPDQQQAANALDNLADEIRALDELGLTVEVKQSSMAGKVKAIQAVKERLGLLQRQYKQFQDATATDLAMLGLSVSDVVSFTANAMTLDDLSGIVAHEQKEAHGGVYGEQ